ncbi:MAG: YceD family protein [Gammaproteobacteria bacterium]|nr:YceD family protein [Gammaproteobacteria bacterium]
MKRLASLLVQPSGDASLEIEFGRDSAGQAIATGKVAAVVWIQCQRCLEPMEVNVDSEFTLAIVSSLTESRRLPENYDPLVVEQAPLLLSELVEDEILLALPAVGVHSEACPVVHSLDKDSQSQNVDSMYNAPESDEIVAECEKKQNPFAVLADLKEKLKH